MDKTFVRKKESAGESSGGVLYISFFEKLCKIHSKM